LSEAVADQRCSAIALIASSPMLGELRPALSTAATKALTHCVASDLTHYTGPELQARVTHALQVLH
jgi:protein required for attachment to host cells